MSLSIPRNKPLILDTNVAVLFYVGMTELELIGKHPRLSGYDKDDFRLLEGIVSNASGLIVSPYVAAEVSNLALDRRNIGKGARDRIAEVFRNHVLVAVETYEKCADCVRDEKFEEFGMADSALLLILKKNKSLNLLTADATLFREGQSRRLKVYNFNYWRNQRKDFQV